MATESDVVFCFSQVTAALHMRETEDSWKKIDQALSRLEDTTKKGAYKHDVYVTLVKENSTPIVSALLSERTKLSGSAADLVMSLAPRLANRFETLMSTFVPPLMQICARTNKVAISRAKKCLLLVAKHCRLPSLLPYLREAAQSKATTLRNISLEVMMALLESSEDAYSLIGRRVSDVECIIRCTATDRDPEVRQWCRKAFELYVVQWQGRVNDFTAAFTPTTRRYLAHSSTSERDNKGAGGSAISASSNSLKSHRRPLEKTQPLASNRTEGIASYKETATIETKPERRGMSEKAGRAPPSHSTSFSDTQRTLRQASSKSSLRNDHRPPQNKRVAIPSVTVEEAFAEQSTGEVEPVIIDDPEIERERETLRAEVVRLSSTTPSRGIAARLALQQFEMQHQARNGQGEAKPRAALTAFAVAASKKSSPKRMPTRVPLVVPPSESKKSEGKSESTAAAQRIALKVQHNTDWRTSSPTKTSPAAQADGRNERPSSPDVFESKPMPREGQRMWAAAAPTNRRAQSKKVSSTLSKGLNARTHLLGTRPESSTFKAQKLSSNTDQMAKSRSPEIIRRPFFAVETENKENSTNDLSTVHRAVQDQAKKTTVSLSALLARKMQLTQSRKM